MGYPNDILATRARLKSGVYAVLPPTGLVNNVIPNIGGCRVSIVASPKMGASFVQYVIEGDSGAGTTAAFSAVGVEHFLFVISGTVAVTGAQGEHVLNGGGYVYFQPDEAFGFKVTGEHAKFLLYKQRYIPLSEHSAHTCYGNVNDIEYRFYDDMENVFIKDLLPVEIGFDMNMHILSFAPGGCHPFVETHVQEHGAYVLEGEGVYYMDNEWFPVKRDDFLWFGPFVTQASYGVGRGNFTYIYSKDCNRDVEL